MRNIKFVLKNSAILLLLISSFVACDDDYTTVGSDIIGQNHFLVDSTREYSVIAYTNQLGPIQTNNLPVYALGSYNDPTYGLTTASIVSQMGSSALNPKFGENVLLDSVVLTIPYFSKKMSVTDEGESIYQLDSIFGSGLINLSIYENQYFLSSIDPSSAFEESLRYFSNMSTSNGPIDPSLLEGSPIFLESDMEPLTNMILDFKPSNKEIKLKQDDEIKTRLSPALRIKLDTDFWQEKIINKQEEPELSNANNFMNYFRGLYLKATSVNGSGTLSLLNLGTSDSNITLYYSKDGPTPEAERGNGTYVLNFSGNKANFFENQFNTVIPQGDSVNGDEKLYLKGEEGSVSVVDMFKGGTFEDGYSPQFMQFKEDFVDTDVDGKFVKSKRLVNEANLVFYVDQALVNGNEPNRIYLYDLKNGTPLIDYFVDVANTTIPEKSKINHLGPLQREGNTSSGQGIKYKIKITEHINNLLLRDSTNVKLGLAVSGNVNLEGTPSQYKVLATDDALVNKVPVSSIITPRGTILYGNNTTDEQKKLYLEIYYTEPNN